MSRLLRLLHLYLVSFGNLGEELGPSLDLKLDLVQYGNCAMKIFQSKINKENIFHFGEYINIRILFLLHGASFFNLTLFLMDCKYNNIIIVLSFSPVIIISIILTGFVLPANDSNYIRNELFSLIFIMICSETFIFSLFLFYSNHRNLYFNIIWHSFLNSLFLATAYIKTKWVINKYVCILNHYSVNQNMNISMIKLLKYHIKNIIPSLHVQNYIYQKINLFIKLNA